MATPSLSIMELTVPLIATPSVSIIELTVPLIATRSVSIIELTVAWTVCSIIDTLGVAKNIYEQINRIFNLKTKIVI